jgi:hypothetical protein
MSNPKFCVEPSLELMVSKENESSITVFYGMDGNNYSIGLEKDVLDGLNPQKWVKENLFDVLLIRMLLRSGREDITFFETVWSKKIILGKYSLDRFEYGVDSRITKGLILFPILVRHHYIVLAYKEENETGQIMEFDSMNHIHLPDERVTLIQKFKAFIVTKKKLAGKTITFRPSIRILCPRQTNFDDCSLYALKNCEWLIHNLSQDASAETISSNLPKYDSKSALKDRKTFKHETESLFRVADVDCNLQNEYLVSCLDDTKIHFGARYFLVSWKSCQESDVRTWEPMTNLYCPSLLIEYFNKKNVSIPTDVKCYLDRFVSQEQNMNTKGCYRRCNTKKFVGCRSSEDPLEPIPEKLLNIPLPQPQIYVMDHGIKYKLVHPKRFVVSEAIYDRGKLVNCFGAALKHVWNIDCNFPTIEKENISATLKRLSGCHLVELILFNSNKIRNINKNRRKKKNKAVNTNPDHSNKTCTKLTKLDYWRIFEVKVGCLLLECSIRSNGAYDHLLVLNFANNYLYESGYEYQPFGGEGKFEKVEALKILSKFNVAGINRVWLITSRSETKGVQTQSVYGDLKVVEDCT